MVAFGLEAFDIRESSSILIRNLSCYIMIAQLTLQKRWDFQQS